MEEALQDEEQACNEFYFEVQMIRYMNTVHRLGQIEALFADNTFTPSESNLDNESESNYTSVHSV